MMKAGGLSHKHQQIEDGATIAWREARYASYACHHFAEAWDTNTLSVDLRFGDLTPRPYCFVWACGKGSEVSLLSNR